MSNNRDIIKLINTKQDVTEFNGTPSVGGMLDGQTAITKSNNKQLALYRKKYGKLWKSYMSYDGNQYVEKNLTVKNDITIHGFPYFRNMPAFHYWQSASSDEQELTTAKYERVTFDTSIYDIGSNFSSNVFTSPVSGIYNFNSQIVIDNDKNADAGDWAAEDSLSISLFKNESNAEHTSQTNQVAVRAKRINYAITDVSLWISISVDLKLEKTDTIGVYFYHDSGHNQYTFSTNLSQYTQFNGHLITAI